MSFLLFVLSWFLPYAIFRKDEQWAEKIRNAHLRLGRIEKNPGARKRHTEAKSTSAYYAAAVMAMIELPFLFILDSGLDGLAEALGVATAAFVAAYMSMPTFEKQKKRSLDKEATEDAIRGNKKPDTLDFLEQNEKFVEAAPTLPIRDQNGSATIASAEESGLIDRDAASPLRKGGR